jgi:uncharacterized BrkB/YihY/UPF0761 family membrane protein
MNTVHEQEKALERRAVRQLALYTLMVVLVSVLLLALNAGMVFGLATSLGESLQFLPLIGELTQLSIFVLPILLLFLEWYAWDVLSSARRRQRR